jgi:hypothetical protein
VLLSTFSTCSATSPNCGIPSGSSSCLVNPDLVVRDEDGKVTTVRYEAVNAMLLNEFLKEHRKGEEEAEINQQQQASIARLEAIVKEQALQIQKVTAQLAALARAW